MKKISDSPGTSKGELRHLKRRTSAPQKANAAPQKANFYPQVQAPLDTKPPGTQGVLDFLPPAGAAPEPAPEPDPSVSMISWGDRVRAVPHDMVRAALFSTAGKKEERWLRADFMEIISVEGLSISMRGEELRQDDLDVWLCVTHLARGSTMNLGVQMTGHALLQELGWGDSQDKYDRLNKCLVRLRGNLIRIANIGAKRGFYGNLICDLAWKDGRTTEPFTLWAIKLDPRLMPFFAPGAYVLADWEVRLNATPLARWLHGFYGSHSVQPHPMKVETIKTLCGSRNKALKSFRSKLKDALALLEELQFLEHWTIDAKTDMVAVVVRKDGRRLPS